MTPPPPDRPRLLAALSLALIALLLVWASDDPHPLKWAAPLPVAVVGWIAFGPRRG